MIDSIWSDMIAAAELVRGARKISDYVEAGEVSAAILSASGKIYTGVCVDTACTLGVCAERNAIFNMITNGEQKTKRVVCIMGDGKVGGTPCGACRELLMQLDKDAEEIEILTDLEAEAIIKLGELVPDWWGRR